MIHTRTGTCQYSVVGIIIPIVSLLLTQHELPRKRTSQVMTVTIVPWEGNVIHPACLWATSANQKLTWFGPGILYSTNERLHRFFKSTEQNIVETWRWGLLTWTSKKPNSDYSGPTLQPPLKNTQNTNRIVMPYIFVVSLQWQTQLRFSSQSVNLVFNTELFWSQ